MDWSRFSSLFDIHCEYRGKPLDEYSMRKGKRVKVELLGPELHGIRLTFKHVFFVDFYKIQGVL